MQGLRRRDEEEMERMTRERRTEEMGSLARGEPFFGESDCVPLVLTGETGREIPWLTRDRVRRGAFMLPGIDRGRDRDRDSW